VQEEGKRGRTDLALQTELALRKGFFGPWLLDDHGHVVVLVVVGGHGGQAIYLWTGVCKRIKKLTDYAGCGDAGLNRV
jgi:hypothetical protein